MTLQNYLIQRNTGKIVMFVSLKILYESTIKSCRNTGNVHMRILPTSHTKFKYVTSTFRWFSIAVEISTQISYGRRSPSYKYPRLANEWSLVWFSGYHGYGIHIYIYIYIYIYCVGVYVCLPCEWVTDCVSFPFPWLRFSSVCVWRHKPLPLGHVAVLSRHMRNHVLSAVWNMTMIIFVQSTPEVVALQGLKCQVPPTVTFRNSAFGHTAYACISCNPHNRH